MAVHADSQRISLQQENKDPNEIEIEYDIAPVGNIDEKAIDVKSRFCFLDYGIGPLHQHPTVKLYFPDIASRSLDYLITSEDVLTHLAQSEIIDLKSSTTAELEFFLCKEFEVHNLQDIGIIITGNLKLEMVMISHVHAARMRVLTEIQKKQLDDFARQERHIIDSYPPSGHGSRKKTGQYRTSIGGTSTIETMEKEITLRSKIDTICAPKLTASSNTRVASFVDQCATFLSDSPYSPSYAKVLEAVDKVSRDRGKNSNNQVDLDKRMKKKRKRRKTEAKSCSNDDVTDWLDVSDPTVGLEIELKAESRTDNSDFQSTKLLLEVVADYVMLFLGGEKYRAKRFSETRVIHQIESTESNSPFEILVADEIETTESNSPIKIILDDCNHGDNIISEIKYSDIVFNDQDSEGILITKPGSKANDNYDSHANIINDNTKNDIIAGSNEKMDKAHSCAIDIDTNKLLQEINGDDKIIENQEVLLIDKVQKRAPFECKLFSLQNYNLSNSCSSLTRNIVGESSIYNIDNNKLREISPWCGAFSGGGESKGAAVLDVNDLRAVGRWGEAMVYQYLLAQSLSSGSSSSSSSLSPTVEWLNIEEETRAGYDLIVRQPKRLIDNGIGTAGRNSMITETTYIEVKTTRFDDLNTFEISLWEWQFATSNPRVRYQIFRVFNAGDSKRVRIVVVEDLLELITSRKVRLCLNV